MAKDEYSAYLKEQVEHIDDMIERLWGGGAAAYTAIAILACERGRLIDKIFEFEKENG